DLIGAGEAEMGASAAGDAGDVAAEQVHRAAVGLQLAGDQVEQRRLAGAVRADDQPPLAGLDAEPDPGGDAQPAKRLFEAADFERAHSPASRARAAGAAAER